MPNVFRNTCPGSGALALCLLLGAILPGAAPACAQDPGQPATNLSLTSVPDGVPPGAGTYYLTKSGLFVELKSAAESAARNRPEGLRTTFRLIHRFNAPPNPQPEN